VGLYNDQTARWPPLAGLLADQTGLYLMELPKR